MLHLCCTDHPQVDPLAWKAEAERLAPQLARIHLPPGQTAAATGFDQEWLARWQTTRQLQQQLGSLVQQQLWGGSALAGVGQRVAGDVQRLLQVEQRVNQAMAEPLGELELLAGLMITAEMLPAAVSGNH
jgi:hypothetical protein